MKNKIPLRLWYTFPAPEVNDFIAVCSQHNLDKIPQNDPYDGWQKWSLPIGNGFMGANVFGRTKTERIQITEKTLVNTYTTGGLNNFAEILIEFGHETVSDYVRELTLCDGIARTAYNCNGIHYTRDVFASYPDRVLVIHMTASESSALAFKLRPYVPFVKQDSEGYSKTGETIVAGDTITLSGTMEHYNIQFEGQLCVITDGKQTALADGISVTGASVADIYMTLGSNYVLSDHVFCESNPKKKLEGCPHPHEQVSQQMAAARAKGYKTLLSRHVEDFNNLFNRVNFDLGDAGCDMPTNELLKAYCDGEDLPYLVKLYYQYGRYLLISSSRPESLPANLQGTWNCYDKSPWGAGFWHNINVQMNYWPSMVTNLSETFESYAKFAENYMPAARRHADDYISVTFPERLEEPGKNGWIIGTAAYPYEIAGAVVKRADGSIDISHSGPGTGAYTSILFWEWYEFTQDQHVLEIAFNYLKEMAHFLNKTVIEKDGHVLVKYSASPEQMIERKYVIGGHYYRTTGCSFDQQMLYENASDLIKAAKLLGREEDPDVVDSVAIIDRLDPVQVGASGQIKEYREENAYGDIGDPHHSFISQLVGLYPGSCINRNTPEWVQASRVTLEMRGDVSTGWAMAHRLNAWARALDGERAYVVFQKLLKYRTHTNLWNSHPPFQVDGNFGGTAGISEMLLQSHAGFVDLLPAIPAAWSTGSFSGLVARGNFLVDAEWKDGKLTEAKIISRVGGCLRIKCDRISKLALYDMDGRLLTKADADEIATIDTNIGDIVYVRAEYVQMQ